MSTYLPQPYPLWAANLDDPDTPDLVIAWRLDVDEDDTPQPRAVVALGGLVEWGQDVHPHRDDAVREAWRVHDERADRSRRKASR